MDAGMETKAWTYQYGEYKIELKPTLGNFELYVDGELQATTKGRLGIQLSGDTVLTAKLPSGEDVFAMKREKLAQDTEIILFVGQLLSPQE
ncbi:MAG: hypothetical protein FWH40_00450 [Coriobacteriia bacterium]|nr:hypothetical protein [Coriobacteriia bacterium]